MVWRESTLVSRISPQSRSPDEYVLYPGNSLKQDKHYFKRAEYDTEGDNGPSRNRCGHAENSLTARRTSTTR